MAPFADLNNNGTYEPVLGDYPVIFGDQALYFIYNDIAGTHTESNGLPLGLEVHGMAYVFNEATNSELSNSVFFNFQIKNKSVNNYHDFYIGLWNDFDLGCFTDDYIGTDVDKNSVFVINADDYDEDCNPDNAGYGENPPALAATFLSHTMTNSMYYYNDYTVTGNPYINYFEGVPEYFYHYLQSEWLDGSHLAWDSSHSNGYGGSEVINYAFPGFSDSLFSGQPSNWYWGSNPPLVDTRILGSVGPMDLPSQGLFSFDVAYIYNPHNGADADGEGRLALSDNIQTIIDLYNSGAITSADEINIASTNLSVSPNPFHDQASIAIPANVTIERLRIVDLSGETVFEKVMNNHGKLIIDAGDLLPGMYVVELTSKNSHYHARIIIE